MQLLDAINLLDEKVPNPTEGLPDEIFYYISRTTPLPNVDLLIKDENNRTLLAWRDDVYSGKGWHIPGGIIRYKETMENRIQQVALRELGTKVEYDLTPMAVNEMIHKEMADRGHCISILFKCFLSSGFTPKNEGKTVETPGYLKWFDKCPDNLLSWHEVYRKFI